MKKPFAPTKLLLALLLPAAMTLAGCGDVFGPDDKVTLSTTEHVYAPGDTVHLRLSNETDSRIRHGPLWCTTRIERRESDGWVDADPVRICPYPVYFLDPGASARWSVPLPTSLQGGDYCARAFVRLDEDVVELTRPFQVRPTTPGAPN